MGSALPRRAAMESSIVCTTRECSNWSSRPSSVLRVSPYTMKENRMESAVLSSGGNGNRGGAMAVTESAAGVRATDAVVRDSDAGGAQEANTTAEAATIQILGMIIPADGG